MSVCVGQKSVVVVVCVCLLRVATLLAAGIDSLSLVSTHTALASDSTSERFQHTSLSLFLSLSCLLACVSAKCAALNC